MLRATLEVPPHPKGRAIVHDTAATPPDHPLVLAGLVGLAVLVAPLRRLDPPLYYQYSFCTFISIPRTPVQCKGAFTPLYYQYSFLPFEPAAHAAGLHFLRDGAEHGRLPPLLGDLAVLPCGVMRSMPPPPLSLFLDAIRDALEGVEDGRRGHVAAAGSGVVCAGRPPCRCGGLWWPSGVVRDHSYKRAGGWACTRQHGGSLFHRRMDFFRISTVRSTVADCPATAASGRTGC